uniref:Uncharacterized protein n=1 Tax=Avena sativa TaxID=4498 RepID=A0ACD5YSC7_AVESA
MADEDVAVSLSQRSPAQADMSGENGDEKVEQHQPFFSTCQPLQTVSYSNSWDSVCAPAATGSCQTSGLDSLDDGYTPSAPCFPDNKEPQSESISHQIDEENKFCSLPSTDKKCDVEQLPPESAQLMDDSDLLDGGAKQQPEPLITEKPSSVLTCHECGHCSETFEPFLDLSLEIDQVDDLVAALESFTKVEQIGDAENKLTCESCNVQVCKDKRLVLDKAPDVIAFQLKRFTTLDSSIEKIDKRVAYPSELDLKPFHSNPDNEQELKYDLYGVVEHSGLPNYGHYVCAIRSSPSSWHLMNDSHVESITETSALHQEAYILFYVRQGMFPWFSSLLEEARSGASPVSVLDNIDPDCSTSGNSSSGDKFEIDEASQCKASLLPKEPNKSCSVDAFNSMNKKEEIRQQRASLQDDVVMRCAPSATEITSTERPSTPPPPPPPKRRSPLNDLDVFEFENLDDEDTPLMPVAEHQSKAKKPKAASASKSLKGSCLDKNANRLIRSMPSARSKALLDCINKQHNVEQGSRSGSRSDPLGKKKRKYGISVPVLQY